MSLEDPSTISDDNSDNDLRDLRDLLPGLFSCKKNEDLVEGDIVWAKYKKLYWPAFIKKVYRKKNKAIIWFTDQPGTLFKVSLSSLIPFENRSKSDEFRKQAIEAGCLEAHDGLQLHASQYVSRKAEGYQDDPLKYFDQTYPYFLVENYLKNNPYADKESFKHVKVPTLYFKQSPEKGINIAGPSKDAVEVERASNTKTDEIMNNIHYNEKIAILCSGFNLKKARRRTIKYSLLTDKDASETDKMFIQSIIECIECGKVNGYLLDIFHKNVPSFYYSLYESDSDDDVQKLKYISFGPVESLDDLSQLINYLITFFKTITSDKKKKDSSVFNPLSNSSFMSSVLLPESIICAISIVRRLSMYDAGYIFHETSFFRSDYQKYVEESLMQQEESASV